MKYDRVLYLGSVKICKRYVILYYSFVIALIGYRLRLTWTKSFFPRSWRDYEFTFSLIDFQPEHREQIVSQAILKLFKETDLDLEPNLPKNDLLSEVDHLPHSKIDSILGDVKGKYLGFLIRQLILI